MHKINCPACCSITTSDKVSFSITELLQIISDNSLDHYINGVAGFVDMKNIRLLLDSQHLWYMTWYEIHDCLNEYGEFVLKGDNFFKRFGADVLDLLQTLDPLERSELRNYSQNPPLLRVIAEIKSRVSYKNRTNLPPNIDFILAELIMYAQSGATLVQLKIECKRVNDDLGNYIATDIHTAGKDAICKNKRCPECGTVLSNLSGKYEEKIISFIGTPAAGKSAYLAAVITKLKKDGGAHGIFLEYDFTSRDFQNFNTLCLEPYSRGFAITKTPEDSFPQISMALRSAKTEKTYLYTFVDIPGEIFADGSSGVNDVQMHTRRGIIKNSDIIWYCVSAKQLFESSIRDKSSINNSEMTDISQLDQNTGLFVDTMFGESEKKPAILVILTKSDLLTSKIDGMVFDPLAETNGKYKDYYFKTIAPAPAEWGGMSYEQSSEIYSNNGTLNYTKLMDISRNTRMFICKNGKDHALSFFSNLSNYFQKEAIPCFSQASYGREPVHSFTTEGAATFLLSHLNTLEATTDRVEFIRIIGEDTVRAFQNNEAYTINVDKVDDLVALQILHGKYNPSKPFGIFPIIDWTLAYTGLLYQGDSEITLECLQATLSGDIPVDIAPPVPSPPPKKPRFFGRK